MTIKIKMYDRKPFMTIIGCRAGCVQLWERERERERERECIQWKFYARLTISIHWIKSHKYQPPPPNLLPPPSPQPHFEVTFELFLLHDNNSPFGGLIAVDVVHSCAGPPDDLKVFPRCDDISCYFGCWPNNESVVILKKGNPFLNSIIYMYHNVCNIIPVCLEACTVYGRLPSLYH